MSWNDRIVCDADTLFGKPRIKGTRIGVEFILDLLASGWSEKEILENYPHLHAEDLQAVFAFVGPIIAGKHPAAPLVIGG